MRLAVVWWPVTVRRAVLDAEEVVPVNASTWVLLVRDMVGR
jgi:hypothetical protein